MRIRAGVVLIEDDKVALIERYRDGRHYYVFPGGGADRDETPEQAAIREMEEETGLRVIIKRKVVEVHFELSLQHYFLAERVSGVYGTGLGEEYTDADPDNPAEGIYVPIWMPVAELSERENVFPADVAALAARCIQSGWPAEPVVVIGHPK